MNKPKWLRRDIAAPGPFLMLCLTDADFVKACKKINVQPPSFVSSEHANATVHFFRNKNTAIVCVRVYGGMTPIQIAGLLVHEAVHIWQEYCTMIGEACPGSEQEAYAIQAISQELMAEFSRRIGAGE